MSNGVPSPDQLEVRERKYDPFKDLSPIEHLFLGSTFGLSNGEIFSVEKLLENEELRKNADFLLKPLGLSSGRSNYEEVLKKRKEKKMPPSSLGHFVIPTKSMKSGYRFTYFLDPPDKEGMLKNAFKFQSTKIGTDRQWTATNEEDLGVFREIVLSKAMAQLFSLDKDESSGVLTLKYLPLLETSLPQ